MVDYTASAADLIKASDKDGDGELGTKEFRDPCGNTYKEVRPDVVKYTPDKTFGFIDKDGTGTRTQLS